MDEIKLKRITNESDPRRFLPAIDRGPYIPAMKEILVWLVGYAADHDWSLNDLAVQAGVSAKTMRSVLKGTYEANVEKHLLSLVTLKARLTLVQGDDELPFVETRLACYTMDLAEFTQKNHYAAILIGQTQWGKTEAVKEYARRHPDTVVLVRCPVSVSPTRLLFRICKQIGVSVNLKPEEMIDRILRYLTPDHLLIVDEIHHVLKSDKMGQKGVEQLRELRDLSGCGLLLTATPEFEVAMETNPAWSGMLKQLSKRNACRVYRLPDVIATEDLRKVWEYYGFPEPDEGMRLSIEATALESGYGVITKRMNQARIAARNAGVPVTWRYYLAAVAKLADMEAGRMPEYV